MADEVTWSATPIGPGEFLYRRVPEGKVQLDDGGSMRFSSRIFRDRNCRPSTYRAGMCGGATRIVQHADDGVLSLAVSAIRELGAVAKLNKDGVAERHHAINVAHMPEGPPPTTDYAHAEIFLTPSTEHDKTCHRMYEALAYMARDMANPWIIEPAALR